MPKRLVLGEFSWPRCQAKSNGNKGPNITTKGGIRDGREFQTADQQHLVNEQPDEGEFRNNQ